MSRMTQLFAVFGLSSALVSATIAACGARPGSAGEMPPVAPRPAPIDPSGAPAAGGPGGLGPAGSGSGAGSIDAGVNPVSPGPVSSRIQRMPLPEVAGAAYAIDDPEAEGVVGSQVPRDAGVTPDGYSPPMQPLPDGGVPIDSRLEPR